MSVVATFEIHYNQFLNYQGELTQDLPEFAKDPTNLIPLYRNMVLTRLFDTKAIALQRTGKMGTYASTLGQEAIGAGIGSAMQTDDVLAPYYRDYGAQLQRGVTMAEIYTYWGGDEFGNCFADNPYDFPISVPIGSQCLHAAGAATAFKIRKENRVAIATCGDGGTSEGDFYEAINVAGIWELPVIFVINNNKWAISVPLSKQTATKTIAQKAIAAGIAGEQVDGNDVIAVRHAVAKAAEKARNGGGATLIETLTYRLCDHTTADDASRYRSEAELKENWEYEPIARLKKYLTNIGSWDDQKETALQDECKSLVEQAVETYLNRPTPALETIFDYHFENMPEVLKEQKNQAMEEATNG